jgi:hypothetical protein
MQEKRPTSPSGATQLALTACFSIGEGHETPSAASIILQRRVEGAERLESGGAPIVVEKWLPRRCRI